MQESELLEAVADDLVTYVLDGELPKDDLAAVVKPPDYPEQYADFERLVDLHFVLRDDVQAFARTLGTRLRAVKTETKRQSSIQRGGIDGRIDWPATYRTRATTSPGNSGLYVTETQTEEYAIPENLVLKALVLRVRDAIENVDRYLDANRTWVADTWAGEQRLREEFQTTVTRNIHLRRIPDPGTDEPTDRMVTRAAASRKALYREAAELIADRHNYDQGDPDAIHALLSDTLISPSGRQTLFELYVLFRVIDALRATRTAAVGEPRYQTLGPGRSAAAVFDGERGLQVYYNQTPQDEGTAFRPYVGTPESRSDIAHQRANEVADAFFTETRIHGHHTKRPDVIVTTTERRGPSQDYLLIEVKDSTRKERIKTGIQELVEYLQFLHRDRGYEFSRNTFGSGLNGLLVVQDLDNVDFVPASLAAQSAADLPIRIVQAQHLPKVLPSLVRRIFC